MTENKIIQEIEITFFRYGTEHNEKVEQSVRNVLPTELGDIPIKFQEITGYFGDPITYYNISIKQQEKAKLVFDYLICNLSTLDRTKLLNELTSRIDRNYNLYIRLDKQKAFLRKTVLNTHDSIRIKVKLRISHKVDPIEKMDIYIKEITA